MLEFTPTGITNLIRRRSGVYYWQAKIGGRSCRGSLRTSDRETARRKLPVVLERAKEKHAVTLAGALPESFGAALAEWLKRQERRPEIKERTKRDYRDRAGAIQRTFPCAVPLVRLGPPELRAWWAAVGKRFAPSTANAMLRVVREVFRMLQSDGMRLGDPSAGLKRIPVPAPHHDLPSPADFERLVRSVRGQRKRASDEAADMIEALAFSGLRIAEMRALQWEDVRRDQIVVRGGPDGTKNREARRVPIVPDLRRVLDRRRYDGAAGAVFNMKTPTAALRAACRREGLPHLRVHDLRHLFATTCIEAGVPFATVASWLGHKDGGALAARVYGHVRADHSMKEAQRVRFGSGT